MRRETEGMRDEERENLQEGAKTKSYFSEVSVNEFIQIKFDLTEI